MGFSVNETNENHFNAVLEKNQINLQKKDVLVLPILLKYKFFFLLGQTEGVSDG